MTTSQGARAIAPLADLFKRVPELIRGSTNWEEFDNLLSYPIEVEVEEA